MRFKSEAKGGQCSVRSQCCLRRSQSCPRCRCSCSSPRAGVFTWERGWEKQAWLTGCVWRFRGRGSAGSGRQQPGVTKGLPEARPAGWSVFFPDTLEGPFLRLGLGLLT